MDIPKKSTTKILRKKRLLAAALLVTGVLYAGHLVSQYRGIEPSQATDFIFGTVSRGELVRDISAPGTLQPTKLRWIAASSTGRVEQILVQPGALVNSDTVIMILSNPTLVRDVAVAKNTLQVAKAQLSALEKRLESNLLTQEAVVAEYDSRYQNASFRLEADQTLAKMGAVAGLDAKANRLTHDQYKHRLAIEKKRQANLIDLHIAELQAKQAELDKATSELQLQQSLVDDLQVKAGMNGILQQVPVEQGQQLNTGVILARVAAQDSYKAELNVQESQVRNVLIGQKVLITAGGQRAQGRVQRIAPAVENGVVIVDVTFDLDGQGLEGARPDLRVDGVIEIERLENVLILPRPVYSQENRLANLYVLDASNDKARLTQINLGSASLDKIQIINGLDLGQKVIISDTRQFNLQTTIALK